MAHPTVSMIRSFPVVQFEMGFKLNNGNSSQLWLNEWAECDSWEIQSSFLVYVAGSILLPRMCTYLTLHRRMFVWTIRRLFSLWLIEFRRIVRQQKERTEKMKLLRFTLLSAAWGQNETIVETTQPPTVHLVPSTISSTTTRHNADNIKANYLGLELKTWSILTVSYKPKTWGFSLAVNI